MTHVAIQNLRKTYPGSDDPALDGLSLEIPSGELTALLGPSGCGKTTAMKIIAGLLAPTSGNVLFDGQGVLDKRPEHRGVVMVFQNNLLFPYMSVAENVGFGLKMRKLDPALIRTRVEEMLALVKLPGMGQRKPSELSGGQQQRVALARALIVEPDVLLLDEPLSNLDAHLRYEMRDLIQSLQKRMKITTIFVTHDQEEAVVLADRVALILDGRLKQYDKAEAFFNRPVDEATARFFGGQNFVEGCSDGGAFDSALGRLALPPGARKGAGKLTFRPENVEVGFKDEGLGNRLSAVVSEVNYLGTQTRLRLDVNGHQIQALANPAHVASLGPGDQIVIRIPESALWVL